MLRKSQLCSAISGWQTTRRLVVHVPDGSTRTISVSQTPDKRYWFGLCCVSSKIGGMKQCGGCHVVGYIGKEEQKQDWPQHKALCKVLQAARANADLWTTKMSPDELLRRLRAGLDRAPTQFELDIAHHPRVCLVCKSGEQQGKLRDCKGCYCAAFCPDHHEDGMAKHAPDCEKLHTAIVDYRNEITVGHQVQNYLPTAETKYVSRRGLPRLEQALRLPGLGAALPHFLVLVPADRALWHGDDGPRARHARDARRSSGWRETRGGQASHRLGDHRVQAAAAQEPSPLFRGRRVAG